MNAHLRVLTGSLLLAVRLAAVSPPPPTIPWRHYVDPEFPAQLLSTTVREGSVTVLFTFDENGRVTDRVALEASHPGFVTSVFAAAESWEIDTTKLGRFYRREFVQFRFERQNIVVSMSQRDAIKAAFTPFGDKAALALKSCREEELDAPLEELATALPVYPPALKGSHVAGEAAVSFVVDAYGRVRVPVVTDATEPEFGEAALVAIKQWRFLPPQLAGLPIQVMLKRTFSFGSRQPAK
jgi:TonB family protein